MTTENFVQGLSILRAHHEDPDGYNLGAGHDIIYVYPTDTPLSDEEVKKLMNLGWHQPDVEEDDEGNWAYDPKEGWGAFV